MLIPGLTDLTHALQLHAFRQQVLANDLANAYTSGYVARDVVATPFADLLDQTMPMRQTDARDISVSTEPSSPPAGSITTSPVLAGTEGAGVDPDATMAEIASNALAYQAIATAAGGEITLARTGLMG